MRLAILFALLLASPAAAQSTDPQIERLIAREHELDRRCLGPEGADPRSPVCDLRQEAAWALEDLGWCYGRRPEMGNRSHWHPCPPGALADRAQRMRDLLSHPPGAPWPPYQPSR